jgi:biotin synthase
MRFMAPDAVMRFAGGRARLSRETTGRILRGGMNGVMIGDLLTTRGNDADEDYALFRRTGYDI